MPKAWHYFFFSFLSPKLLWPIPQSLQCFRRACHLPKEASGRSNLLPKRMVKHIWSRGGWKAAHDFWFPTVSFQLLPTHSVFRVWICNADGSELLTTEPLESKRAILSHGTSCCWVSIKVSWLLNKLSSKAWHQNTKWVTFFVGELTAQLCVRYIAAETHVQRRLHPLRMGAGTTRCLYSRWSQSEI